MLVNDIYNSIQQRPLEFDRRFPFHDMKTLGVGKNRSDRVRTKCNRRRDERLPFDQFRHIEHVFLFRPTLIK